MTTPSFSFLIHIFLSLLIFLSINSGSIKGMVNAKMSWCVAKPSTSEEQLQADLDYACSKVNCSDLRGGPCSYPDSKPHLASFAMNLYYNAYERQPHTCDFKRTALIASSDPSYSKNCTYLGGEAQIPDKTWCVAKPATDNSALRDIIRTICSRIDCGMIKPQGPCYIGNNLWNQASVAMNLFYVQSSDHKCDFKNAGLLVVVDPSFGSCNMPGRQA